MDGRCAATTKVRKMVLTDGDPVVIKTLQVLVAWCILDGLA
jgi:hypothetical protein